MRRAASIPPMVPLTLTSIRTQSGRSRSAVITAASPDATMPHTVNPLSSSVCWISYATMNSSSTMSMRWPFTYVAPE
jgi:hypothetical protein